MSDFPMFTELPAELQDEIWNFTIRDNAQPAAHFLSMAGSTKLAKSKQISAKPPSKTKKRRRSGEFKDAGALVLGAPINARFIGEHSWSQNNASVYM